MLTSPAGSYDENCNEYSDIVATNAIAIGEDTGIIFFNDVTDSNLIYYAELQIEYNSDQESDDTVSGDYTAKLTYKTIDTVKSIDLL